jgi:hypothetical protein
MISISRREFANVAGLMVLSRPTGAQSATPVTLQNQQYTNFRGFNYQPSWGSSGMEIWRQFDGSLMDVELSRGKKYFPGMTAIRLWLSWDAFVRSPGRFEYNFETALDIAHKYGLAVLPVLFNRWHDGTLDYGGIYLDHFVPGVSWLQSKQHLFQPYLEAVVGKHAGDSRVFAWDLCNEPFSYNNAASASVEPVRAAEMAWLEMLYKTCKQLGTRAPVTVGFHPGADMIEPVSDIFSIHPYWVPPPDTTTVEASRAKYEKRLNVCVEIANKFNKPLLATETCWGSVNDADRVEIIRYTLTELKKRKIGWLAYLLHHSLIADAHRVEYAPVGGPGNLSFIEADGSLRPGHEVFNEF